VRQLIAEKGEPPIEQGCEMMIAMPKGDVLARVDADLARGLVHPAMQRLASLTAAYPADVYGSRSGLWRVR
jgi:hypothetical protein